jgi:hydroxymethylglutaryl-CoA synthase
METPVAGSGPVGIVGYGAYVPCYRVATETIAAQWGRDPALTRKGLGLAKKTVPGFDEDAATIAVQAARYALARAKVDPARIGALYVGSESHPYAVKPTGTIVSEALGIGPEVHVADFEFACKAGTEAMFCALSHVAGGQMAYAFGIGADTSQGAPLDPLEYTASAGGAAYLFGCGAEVVAEVEATHTYATDTPDFWRRDGQFYPSHAGRFTGEPAYFRHIVACTKGILQKAAFATRDFRYVVFHMPNGKFPLAAAKQLGFTQEQILPGLVVTEMGNAYSGSSPCGLAAVLDEAAPGDRILMVSFGSGAGSDGFVLRTTERLSAVQRSAPKLWEQIRGHQIDLDYARYAQLRGKILHRGQSV